MAQKYQSEWSQKISTKEQFQIMKRLFGYTKRYKKQFIGAIIAAAGLATINILLPRLLQVFMYLYLGVILKAITQFAQSFLFGMGSERAMEDVRRDLFRQLHRLGMRYFDQTPAGSIVSRVTNDTMTLIAYWNVFLSLLVGSFSIISAFIAMWLLSPKIALATAGFLPILLVIIWYYSSYSAKVYRH